MKRTIASVFSGLLAFGMVEPAWAMGPEGDPETETETGTGTANDPGTGTETDTETHAETRSENEPEPAPARRPVKIRASCEIWALPYVGIGSPNTSRARVPSRLSHQSPIE